MARDGRRDLRSVVGAEQNDRSPSLGPWARWQPIAQRAAATRRPLTRLVAVCDGVLRLRAAATKSLRARRIREAWAHDHGRAAQRDRGEQHREDNGRLDHVRSVSTKRARETLGDRQAVGGPFAPDSALCVVRSLRTWLDAAGNYATTKVVLPARPNHMTAKLTVMPDGFAVTIRSHDSALRRRP
jgi:hypothetical protein